MSQKYKFDESSMRNTNVSMVSAWILKVSREALDKKPNEIPISRYLFPRPELFVNTSKAEGVVEGQFNYYGPYVVESKNPTMSIKYEGPKDVFSIVNNVSGTVVPELSVNSPFYVRFDKSYISNIEIKFSGESNVPLFFSCTNFIAMIDNSEVSETELVVGSSNASGKIVYIKTDAETDAYMSGVAVEVSDASGRVVATITTGANGIAETPELLLGKYSVVEVNTLPGYQLDDTIHSVDLLGSGQVERLTSKGYLTSSFVTFLSNDVSSGFPVGGSVFDVLNEDSEVVAKIGFNSTGRCANIELDEGKYFLREIVSDPNYEYLVDLVEFESKAGVTTEVKILKTLAFSKTVFVVKDSQGSPISNGSLQLFKADGSMITEISTGSSGEVSVSLPVGDYYVKNVGTGVYYTGQTIPFVVDTTNVDKTVEVGVVTYDAVVFGVVYGMDGGPMAGVSLIAIDDLGNEYSTAVTAFDGVYELGMLPRGSAIFVTVYKAPFGVTGEFVGSNKVITSSDRTERNVILKTLEEVNAERSEEDQIVQWDFYKVVGSVVSDDESSSSFGFDSGVNLGDGSGIGGGIGDGPGTDPLLNAVGTTQSVVTTESVTEEQVVTTEEEVVTTEEREEEPEVLFGLSKETVVIAGVVVVVVLVLLFRPKKPKVSRKPVEDGEPVPVRGPRRSRRPSKR
jgi:hypothetical protein